jgi:hypothetical protein
LSYLEGAERREERRGGERKTFAFYETVGNIVKFDFFPFKADTINKNRDLK